MATINKSTRIKVSPWDCYGKHIHPFLKKICSKKERKAAKYDIEDQLKNMESPNEK